MKIFSFCLSKFYLLVYSFVFWLYKHHIIKSFHLKNMFVVSVGNLTVGGSGKTPFVIFLSKLLTKYNQKHFIVSRGYKKKLSGEAIVSNGKSLLLTPALSGDEPYLLGRLLPFVPVVVGDKLRAIELAKESFGLSACIIDDGFQTFKIKKNIEILLLDASVSLNQYKLLPHGVLREPLKQIIRADVVVLTKTNFISKSQLSLFKQAFLKYINKKQQLLLCAEYVSQLLVLESGGLMPHLKNSLVDDLSISISGVARPESFNSLVKKYFSNIHQAFSFSDHFEYNNKQVEKIKTYLRLNHIVAIVTTYKDFVKIGTLLSGVQFYVIDIQHRLDDLPLFESFLIKKFKKKF